MSLQRMDADTAETVAGVVRLLRRAAQLVWDVVDAERAGSPRHAGIGHRPSSGRGAEPPAGRNSARRTPCRSGMNPAGLLRSAEHPLRRVATTPGA